jgi:quercetin dioxygenase-like cupin family protein
MTQETPTTPATLLAIGDEQLEKARRASNGRASTTVHRGSRLRQTLVALVAGTRLGEHASPGDATVLCLRGHVALSAGEREVDVPEGALLDVPSQRHDLRALEDSLVVLTVGVG